MFVFGLTGVSVCGLCWVCVFGLWWHCVLIWLVYWLLVGGLVLIGLRACWL